MVTLIVPLAPGSQFQRVEGLRAEHEVSPHIAGCRMSPPESKFFAST